MSDELWNELAACDNAAEPWNPADNARPTCGHEWHSRRIWDSDFESGGWNEWLCVLCGFGYSFLALHANIGP